MSKAACAALAAGRGAAAPSALAASRRGYLSASAALRNKAQEGGAS